VKRGGPRPGEIPILGEKDKTMAYLVKDTDKGAIPSGGRRDEFPGFLAISPLGRAFRTQASFRHSTASTRLGKLAESHAGNGGGFRAVAATEDCADSGCR